jgi:hypothetical protein
MRRFNYLLNRIAGLETCDGYVILEDGTRFRPKDSGIHTLIAGAKLRRDLGRAPKLSDFTEEEQEQWRCYAKWNPDPGKHGAISVLLSQEARKLCRGD